MLRLTQSVLVCICLIAIGLMLTSQSLAGVTDLKAAATGIWLFDEGKGTAAKDAAGKGLDGVIKGNAKWVNGKFGKALELDGKTAYVEIPKHKNPTEAITVWHMYAGTFNSKTGEWKIFIDGKEASKLDLDKKPLAAEAEKPLFIGRDTCCDDRYGKIVIDEAAVFNIALTAGQQQGIMSTGLGAAITAVEAIEKLATTWSSLKTQ